MSEYKYRLTETDHYLLEQTPCKAVYLLEHSDRKDDIEVVVSPQMGMSLLGFSIKHVSLLQKSRRRDFLAGRKGLGPLILPHFNQRTEFPRPEGITPEVMPHLRYLNDRGIKDPFQHGIGRYAAWSYTTEVTDRYARIVGRLTGSDTAAGISLAEITGFDFTAQVTYTLQNRTLIIGLEVSARQPVAAGIHFYYALPREGLSEVAMTVESIGLGDDDSLFEFSAHQRDGKFYRLPLDSASDTVFSPVAEEKGIARYKLITPEYRLDTRVAVAGDPEQTFDSVVVFHPAGSDFVCIEPLSERNGLKPTKKRFSGTIELHPILP